MRTKLFPGWFGVHLVPLDLKVAPLKIVFPPCVVRKTRCPILRLWAEFENCATASSVKAGKGPLAPDQLGRAATVDTFVSREALPPPCKGRQGEVCQAFVAFNLQVARFTKQVRRLQAYFQATLNKAEAIDPAEARSALWRATRKAPGFRPSFPAWWLQRPVEQCIVCMTFPVVPPDNGIAAELFRDLQANVDCMQSKLEYAAFFCQGKEAG